MPTITRLELQARRKDRVNVFLDDEYAFSLALELAAGLRKGQVLGEDDLARLRLDDDYRYALGRAMGFLAHRPRSRVELDRYLAARAVPPEVAQRVVGRLAELGLVDDAAFAAWWVDNRRSHRPRGAMALRQELARLGVSDEAAREAIGELDEDELALRLAVEHGRRLQGLERALFERRLGGFLARRGFSYGAVAASIAEAWRTWGAGADEEALSPDD